MCFQILSWAGIVTGTVKDAETSEELVGAQNANVLNAAVITGEALHNTEAANTKEQQEAHVTMTGVS